MSALIDADTAALTVTLELTAGQVEMLAERVAVLLAAPTPAPPPEWLNTAAAAAYLCCKPGRIHDLVQLGRLTPARDGTRLLFRRSELDRYLTETAA
jgi:excisionase family DNA binding protein